MNLISNSAPHQVCAHTRHTPLGIPVNAPREAAPACARRAPGRATRRVEGFAPKIGANAPDPLAWPNGATHWDGEFLPRTRWSPPQHQWYLSYSNLPFPLSTVVFFIQKISLRQSNLLTETQGLFWSGACGGRKIKSLATVEFSDTKRQSNGGGDYCTWPHSTTFWLKEGVM